MMKKTWRLTLPQYSEKRAESRFSSPHIRGILTLRHKIIAYLRTKGIKAGLNQVQILSETNQALDFIVTSLLNPGDRVITEEPVSPDVYRVIELAGGRPVTVPVDENGMICDNLEALIETHRPQIYLCQFQLSRPYRQYFIGRSAGESFWSFLTVIDCQLSRKTLLQNCLLKKSFCPRSNQWIAVKM